MHMFIENIAHGRNKESSNDTNGWNYPGCLFSQRDVRTF
ncbi:hypothetical protein ALT1000_250056 [Alteromonas macleodii]